MSEAHELAQRYLDAWNEDDAGRRCDLIVRAFREEITYVDPHAEVGGHEGLGDLIGAVRTRFPGHVFTLCGTPQAHHDRLRFSWVLASAGGDPVACGTDVALVATDGRLRAVTGFLDATPAA